MRAYKRKRKAFYFSHASVYVSIPIDVKCCDSALLLRMPVPSVKNLANVVDNFTKFLML